MVVLVLLASGCGGRRSAELGEPVVSTLEGAVTLTTAPPGSSFPEMASPDTVIPDTTALVASPAVVIAAAGDIACAPGERGCADAATAALLDARHAAVLVLGDAQYDRGTAAEFSGGYAQTWGRALGRSWPVIGNHERLDGGRGYASYFAPVAARAGIIGSFVDGWYAFDVGGWRIVALDSNCRDAVCAADGPQVAFLRTVLEESAHRCTLVFMHHPRWSSGAHGDDARVDGLWRALAAGGADIVLSGHDHHYERFYPRGTDGIGAADGPVQYVVGTGGAPLRRVTETPLQAGVVENLHGVVEIELGPSWWRSRFLGVDGVAYDPHTGQCGA